MTQKQPQDDKLQIVRTLQSMQESPSVPELAKSIGVYQQRTRDLLNELQEAGVLDFARKPRNGRSYVAIVLTGKSYSSE